MSNCVEENCSQEAYEGNDRCILHCGKGTYPEDFHGKLIRFYSALVDYIIEDIFEIEEEVGNINKNNIAQVLKDARRIKSATGGYYDEIERYLKDREIAFSGIYFPQWDNRDPFNYTKLFPLFGGIHFDGCKFTAYSLGDPRSLKSTGFFFQDCNFYGRWKLDQVPLLENVNNVLYQECVFHEDTFAFWDNDVRDPENKIDYQLFHDCNFLKDLSFEGIEFGAPIFNNSGEQESKLTGLRISGCLFKEGARFILNRSRIDEFSALNTVFKDKVEFKANIVDKFEVMDSNFSKLLDCHGTKFKDFAVFKCIFDDFVGFEDSVFGQKDSFDEKFMPVFKFATFNSLATFRGAKFYSGLDLLHANLEDNLNFLNAEIEAANTNRETFRIVKNSFDRIGNHIEANRFYVMEMKKYREELRNSGKFWEKLVLAANQCVSDFGQNYWRPVGLIIVTAIIYWLLELGYDDNTLYKIFPPANAFLSAGAAVLNGVAKGVLPISRFLHPGMEFIGLLFYIIYAVLIWQTLVALKRHTRR